ncbi:Dihydropteroate synthase [Microbacterium esteraromaticum]|uniref:Dihydropteroate synthase n=1 Tax=Microbacterium esteraromaticum TaxID=57043 RepID=A0A1R4KPV2_9MICO|nr:dihydropteroate synthase [Microbacterium esteraromaticum]SJN46034.1 Dihydropteroate synthase [Microbacterium esteraromaticum]
MTGIWGILNVTPDSFSDGGRYADPVDAVEHARVLHAQGAGIIDVGGESTRPGAMRVSLPMEQQRALPVIEALTDAGIPTSIDTLNADTAVAAVRAGARVVNDVSGGLADERMLAAVADSGADIVLGHWRGPSTDMYARAQYERVAREVAAELRERMTAAASAGIAPDRIIVDPGIGFAKSGEQNWQVLRGLDELTALGCRVMIGTSRKRFLTETLGGGSVSEQRRDLSTAVTSALAARAGVWAVRVHDVAATRDALAIVGAWDGV